MCRYKPNEEEFSVCQFTTQIVRDGNLTRPALPLSRLERVPDLFLGCGFGLGDEMKNKSRARGQGGFNTSTRTYGSF